MDIFTSLNKKYFPINGEFKISLNKNFDHIIPNDFHFEKIFSEAYKEVYGKELDKDSNHIKYLTMMKTINFMINYYLMIIIRIKY